MFEPIILQETKRSLVEQISIDRVKKTYKNDLWKDKLKDALKREVKALEMLEKFDHYPKLIEVGDNYIVMSYVGKQIPKGRVNDSDSVRGQCLDILDELGSVGIIHRDVRKNNLLTLDGKLYLIDFSSCAFAGEDYVPTATMSDRARIFRLFGAGDTAEITEKIKAIRGREYEGSSMRSGKMYHELPFAGLQHFRKHRGSTVERVSNIVNLVKGVQNKTILDMGCSVGGLALGMVERGAKHVIGIDHDPRSIDVAKAAAEYLGYSDRTRFDYGKMSLEWAKALPTFDIILWMSQWMWMVHQKGRDYSKEMMFEISRKGNMMVFESAADDGMARMRGISQDDIERWLFENTCYESIVRTPTTSGWMNRDIFICKNPLVRIESTKRAACSIIERVAQGKIKKTFRESPVNYRWMQEREVKALKLLDKFDDFPKLLEVGEDYIVMDYAGRQSKVDTATMKDQAWKIYDILQEVGIIHRDLIDRNFLALNGKLNLIDFGWCVFKGEENPPKLNKGIMLKTGGVSDKELLTKLFGKR